MKSPGPKCFWPDCERGFHRIAHARVRPWKTSGLEDRYPRPSSLKYRDNRGRKSQEGVGQRGTQ